MTTVAQCPNPSCGRISHLGDDPLGRIFRCPRCLTKLRPSDGPGPGSGSGSNWTTRATRRTSTARFAAPVAFGSGSGSGGVAVLARPLASAPPTTNPMFGGADSGEFLAGAFDHDHEPWDDLAEAASGFEWNESTYNAPAIHGGGFDASRTAIYAVPRQWTADAERLDDRGEGGLGRFQILNLLGEGRHARVYRAFDPTLERQVALKLMREGAPRSSRAQERFLGEARALAKLRHPGIVSIFEAGRDGERLYLALDLIEGRSLADVLAEGRLSHRRGAEIAADLAEALAYAHGLGIVHRDVKPANVRLDARGGVHLMDFGIACRPDAPEPDSSTTGSIVGTPAYLAPEQLDGPRRDALPASDQYSLGAVLFELLCGRPPFDGPASSVLARASAVSEPPCPTTVDPCVPRPLAEICRKARARKPTHRYASCQDLAADLRRWLGGERPQARRRTWFA